MHKDFYASGFLYHPPTEQILLQQISSAPSMSAPWILIGGLYLQESKPEELLKNVIYNLLALKIDVVHPVYSYYNEIVDNNQYIGYAKVRSRQNFPSEKGLSFAWFSFKDVLKLQITKQTKHDIVVGQRVIEAAERKRQGLHTFQ